MAGLVGMYPGAHVLGANVRGQVSGKRLSAEANVRTPSSAAAAW